MPGVVVRLCLWLLLAPVVLAGSLQDRRGENLHLVRINETLYFGDLLQLALKDIAKADVIFDYGGPDYSANISSSSGSYITLSNCKVTSMHNITLSSTRYEVNHLNGWQYSAFSGTYMFADPVLSYDYSVKNTSGVNLSTGVATLRLKDEGSMIYFYVDNNSTGQYHILRAFGTIGVLSDLARVELSGASDTEVNTAVWEIYHKYSLQFQTVPMIALNSYILKYMNIIDVNDYVIKK